MRNKLTFTAIALAALMTACNSKNNSTVVPTSVELPGTVDKEAFAANIESISVMNLQMDDKWSLAGYQHLAFADNYTYMVENRGLELLCFDNKTGEKISGRTIKGNGPGEINYLSSIFCIGDTLCVCDHKRVIGQYNQKCAFLGRKFELDESFMNYIILRLSNGGYALVTPFSFASDTTPALYLTDSQFNVKSKHFTVPQSNFFISFGPAPDYYANGDTVRFFVMYDNHLFTVYGETEQSIEFVLPNPMTLKIVKEMIDNDNFFNLYEYDGNFNGLGESGKFVTFIYSYDKSRYRLLLDKRTNNVVSIKIDEDFEESATGLLLNLFKKAEVFQTDGKYLYAKCKNSDIANILDGHDDLLDARLQKTRAEYRAYLEQNADYIKSLEPEERDAASILLKIKLKD
ncbi:MAG: 6-bladed beta-propeller [Salinivirgaceae bacterium]|nr:6-bladed beta-propeller [Salinivirgaceae bacterium]